MRHIFRLICFFVVGCSIASKKSPTQSEQTNLKISIEKKLSKIVETATACFSCEGSTNPGGPCYSGPGGAISTSPSGACYGGPGGNLYAGPGGNLYSGPSGNCHSGPGGNCYAGPGGNCANGIENDDCPKICGVCSMNLLRKKK